VLAPGQEQVLELIQSALVLGRVLGLVQERVQTRVLVRRSVLVQAQVVALVQFLQTQMLSGALGLALVSGALRLELLRVLVVLRLALVRELEELGAEWLLVRVLALVQESVR
jgi:hypothetical protein